MVIISYLFNRFFDTFIRCKINELFQTAALYILENPVKAFEVKKTTKSKLLEELIKSGTF